MKKILTCLGLAFFSSQCGSSGSPDIQAESQEQVPEAALAAKNNSFLLELTWQEKPVSMKYISAGFHFFHKNGQAITTIRDITFDPQMPSMGHGTATDQQKITKADSSKYQIENVYFVMSGEWVINITATVDGKTDTVTVPVTVLKNPDNDQSML